MAALERVDDGTFGIAGVESSEKVELSFDIEDEAVEDLSVLFLLRRLDNSMETAMIHGGYEKGVLGVILFGLIIRAVPHSWKEPQGLEVEDKSRVYERIGMLRILTLESRESEFWGKDATSIVLV
ncbi:hypothetical protein G7Y89_g11817 [Cudoniella acicularis]|uniref:Uncharacterized protein n=1 Tax=Cudoniella acicularis TaxID=354080 RepID=A0A8H4RBN6_9HELO|nr:hypothetical protein G7Y89_g11817 [Cudoniella acicularis]